MVYSANIVTVAEMQLFAGVNVGTADTDANHILLQDYAEAYLSNLLKYDLDAAGFTALDATKKILISEWAARFAGNELIANDMSGYTDGIEAENMIKINWQRMLDIEKLINDGTIAENSTRDYLGTS